MLRRPRQGKVPNTLTFTLALTLTLTYYHAPLHVCENIPKWNKMYLTTNERPNQPTNQPTNQPNQSNQRNQPGERTGITSFPGSLQAGNQLTRTDSFSDFGSVISAVFVNFNHRHRCNCFEMRGEDMTTNFLSIYNSIHIY